MVKIDGEYIKEWLVLGPFFPDNLEKDFLAEVGGEANIVPKEGDTITTLSFHRNSDLAMETKAEEGTLTWKQYSSETNIISLLDAIGYHESATAYVFCVLQSDIADDFHLYLASTDGIMVWINSELVYSSPVGEIFDVEEDILSPPIDKYLTKANLKAGPNHCLIKVTKFNRIGGDWEFAMRVLPPECAVISGIITDENGEHISNADVRLEQAGKRTAQTTTDNSGSYQLGIYPVVGQYDLCATSNEKGVWRLGIRPGKAEQRKLYLKLKEAINIEGSLLMLDNATPHVSIVVQAVIPASDKNEAPEIVATTLSDENGRYRFVNLKPGKYQVCCQVLDGYVYYRDVSHALRFTPYGSEAKEENSGDILSVEQGRKLKNINFRFPPFKKGNWRNYTYFDGLAHTSVNAICRAPDGMMWFGTEGGVSRYDGKEFVNFTTKEGLAANTVNAIHCSPDGIIWFATDGGVSRYDGNQFVNFTTQNGLADNNVNTIHCSPDGAMWFATGGFYRGSGVSRYDGKEFVNFTAKDGLANNAVLTICSDFDGRVWFGTWGGGVSRYDGKDFINFTTKDGLAGNSVYSIHYSPDGMMWFGAFYQGLSRYNEKEFVNFTIEDGLANNTVFSMHSDQDGVMWFGTRGHGVSRYDGKRYVNFTPKDGLVDGAVGSIYRDLDGVMWFGTWGGVSRYDESEFINISTKDGLASNDIWTIDCFVPRNGPDRVMWFGTWGGGVSRYDGSSAINFTKKDGLPNNRVLSIHRDVDGTFWFGTDYGGVCRYDGKNFINFTTKDGLAGDCVFDIQRDLNGILWFGVIGGLSRYDGKTFTNFTERDGLPHHTVVAISCSPDGIIWLGTRGGGVSRYDGSEFVNFTTEDGLAGNLIWDIYRDVDGTLWFGTFGGGVSRYDGSRFVNFTTEDGLAHDKVASIYRDVDGTLWFGTDGGGVSHYDGIAWTSLDVRDGLVGNTVQSIYQDENGTLWFGTGSGITCHRSNTTPPQVRINSVRIKDQLYTDLAAIPPITVGEYITVEYSAIDFKTIPEKRQYRYRIQELDSDWHRPTGESQFDWTPEEIGTYTFEVQAIDRDLNYSQPAMVKLEVIEDPRDRQIAELESELERRNRELEAELQDARDVQMSLMPELAPYFEGIELTGKCLPANTVSGDFFDYLAGKHKKEIALVVADVTGKAMKGAMNAVMVDGILHAVAKDMEQLSPAFLMMGLNDVLTGRMEQYMNVTMVIGTIDAETKTLTFANAAHHAYPLLLRKGEIRTLKTGGLPLGMRAGIQYREEKVTLQSGDVVIFMTDGIIEAQDSSGEMYSDSGRLEEIIKKFTQDMSASTMVDAIISDAMDFGGNKTNRDANLNTRLRLSAKSNGRLSDKDPVGTRRLTDDMTVVVARMI